MRPPFAEKCREVPRDVIQLPLPTRKPSGLLRRRFDPCAGAPRGRYGRALRNARARAAEERGITIIEMLVTMAVMIIILSALTTVAVEASNSEVRTNKRYRAQVAGRLALDKVRRELHCAGSVAVVNSSGTTLAAGVVGNGIYTTLGGYCPSNGLTTNGALLVKVTWCTSASTLKTGTFALYRLASLSTQPACATTGVKWADYLTTATPFCIPSTSASCGGIFKPASSLSTLYVNFPVNINGASSTTAKFTLVDNIALRNSVRG